MRIPSRKAITLKVSLLIFIFLASSIPSWAILGVRRRTARRTAVVVHSQDAAAAQQQQQASAQQQQQQTAAAQQQTAEAQQQAAAAAAAPKKTTQQQLEDLQSLYKQGLITEADYDAQKQKILDEMD